jgi:uncharacterized RDD family membrane protein YckC
MDRYSTFWPRFWAGLVDGLALTPAIGLVAYVCSQSHNPAVWVISNVLLYSVGWVYTVAMHTRYGQTLGKMLTKVQVLNVGEDRVPSLHQSLIREIGEIVPACLGLAYTLYRIAMHTYLPTITANDSLLLNLVSYAQDAWFLLEIVTMLTNKKRRALHDLIAGTVVVHVAYSSVTTGLGLSQPGRTAPEIPRSDVV